VKKISMLIAVVSVLGAMAQSALAQNLVAFSGGIGDITTGSANTTVRGVAAAGQIWVIKDLTADVMADGLAWYRIAKGSRKNNRSPVVAMATLPSPNHSASFSSR